MRAKPYEDSLIEREDKRRAARRGPAATALAQVLEREADYSSLGGKRWMYRVDGYYVIVHPAWQAEIEVMRREGFRYWGSP